MSDMYHVRGLKRKSRRAGKYLRNECSLTTRQPVRSCSLSSKHKLNELTQNHCILIRVTVCSGGIDKIQSRSKANAHIVLSSSWAIKGQSGANRVRFPIVKWSKHGCIVIALPEINQATRVDTILQCGDFHPQPGPHTSKSNTNEGRAIRLAKSIKSTKYVTTAHLNVRSMVSCENFHLIKQTISSNECDIFTI